MEKIDSAKSSVLRHVLIFLALAFFAAGVIGMVVAFCSVLGVYFRISTLLTVGFVIFSLLSTNYLIMSFLGKGDVPSVALVNIVQLLTVTGCLFCIYFDVIYAIPLAFLALVLGTDFDKHVALSTQLTCTTIVAICMSLFFYRSATITFSEISLEIMCIAVNVGMSSLLIFFIKPYSTRLHLFFVAGTTIICFALIGFITAAAGGDDPDVTTMITVGVSILAGGAVSLLAYYALSPILERVFNLNTGLRLMELCSFDQPLLKELEEKAPGTFNHSLTVANISERAAYAIGENPTLAKAAALFHDIGKIENPEYFTENQTNGYNPHDDLIPEASVKMITRHTEAGARILREKGFPEEIVSAAIEHHGDSSVGYFYHKAQTITEGTLDEAGYTYPGPKPHSKINAIIMIADIAEAATRSTRPSTREELVTLVDKLVRQKMGEKQFDECPITISEITKVKEAVVNTLMGVHHERIAYDLDKKKR